MAWTLGLITFDLFWGYSPITVHVALGIGLLPLVAMHALRRRRQNAASPPIRSRRTALRVSALGIGTLAGWQLDRSHREPAPAHRLEARRQLLG